MCVNENRFSDSGHGSVAYLPQKWKRRRGKMQRRGGKISDTPVSLSLPLARHLPLSPSGPVRRGGEGGGMRRGRRGGGRGLAPAERPWRTGEPQCAERGK